MTKRIGMLGRGLAVTLTAGVAFGLAGCGDQGASGPGYASKDNVVQESDSDAPLAADEIISVSYGAAMEAGSSHMTMTMKGAATMSAEGDMTYDAGASEMRMTLSMPQVAKGKVEMRRVGQQIYMQIPGLTPPGKFFAIDPQDQSSPMGKSFAGLSEQVDPLAGMKSMESAVTKADRVGESKIDGARVDHYVVTVDAVKMMKDLEQKASPGAPETITYDLWLDADNLMRKMTFDVSGAQVEMLLSDWGKPVEVKRPAPSEIVKAPGA